jgi:hypothetical protein
MRLGFVVATAAQSVSWPETICAMADQRAVDAKAIANLSTSLESALAAGLFLRSIQSDADGVIAVAMDALSFGSVVATVARNGSCSGLLCTRVHQPTADVFDQRQ